MAKRKKNEVSYKVKDFSFGKNKIPGIILLTYNGDPVCFQIGVFKENSENFNNSEYFLRLKDYPGHAFILGTGKFAFSYLSNIEKAKDFAYTVWINISR